MDLCLSKLPPCLKCIIYFFDAILNLVVTGLLGGIPLSVLKYAHIIAHILPFQILSVLIFYFFKNGNFDELVLWYTLAVPQTLLILYGILFPISFFLLRTNMVCDNFGVSRKKYIKNWSNYFKIKGSQNQFLQAPLFLDLTCNIHCDLSLLMLCIWFICIFLNIHLIPVTYSLLNFGEN
jgi:hypothetical protein